MTDKRLEEALRHLNPPSGVNLWHGGATVIGTLRGVTPEMASWKPAPDRHSIWALVLHIAYWKYAVRRRITGEERGGFPRKPSNWPAVPDQISEKNWKNDRALLRDAHVRLIEAMESFDSTRLDDFAGGQGQTTFSDLVFGIVLHDTYHVAQIQMLKRLCTGRSNPHSTQ